MVAIHTPICDFGWNPPAFELGGIDGKTYTLDDVRGPNGTLVMFICNHCPFVIHVRDELARLGRDYSPDAVSIVAINSNDVERFPSDGPVGMREEIADGGYMLVCLRHHCSCGGMRLSASAPAAMSDDSRIAESAT